MSLPDVQLTDIQEEVLRTADVQLEEATQEFEDILHRGTPNRPITAGMSEEERRRYDAARTRVRALSEEREALRARLFAERTEELRRQHLAGMVADQEQRRAAARAGTNHASSSGGLGAALKRLVGRR
jgi:hypothetical protein